MRKIKTILLSALVTIIAFGAITYTSCKKDPCSGVTCLNGGACSNGNCLCPAGYVGSDCGTLATTSVTYDNDTYTPVYVVSGGTTYTVPVGSSVTFNGDYGSALNATAYTSGTSSSGTQVGALISWDLSTTFPASGTSIVGVDVSSDYFFLKIQNNNSSNSAQGVYVNYGTSAQTFDNISIPNNGQVYSIGYYLAYSNTELFINASSGGNWTLYPYTTATAFFANQSYTGTLN